MCGYCRALCARSSSRTCTRRPSTRRSGPFVRDQVEALRRRAGVEVELVRTSRRDAHLRRGPRASCGAATRRGGVRRRARALRAHRPGRPCSPGLRAARRDAARQRPLPPALATASPAPRSRSSTLPAAVSRAFSANVPGAGRTRRVAVLPVRRRPRALPARSRARRRARRLGLDPDGPLPAVPARPARPLKRVRPRAGGGRRRTAARRWAACPPEEVPYWINAANAVLVPSQDEGFGLVGARGAGLRRARVRHAGRSTRSRWRGSTGALCAAVGPRRLARRAGAAPARRGDPRVDGRARRRAVLGRPHGRARRRRVARAWLRRSCVSGHLYSAVRGRPVTLRTA